MRVSLLASCLLLIQAAVPALAQKVGNPAAAPVAGQAAQLVTWQSIVGKFKRPLSEAEIEKEFAGLVKPFAGAYKNPAFEVHQCVAPVKISGVDFEVLFPLELRSKIAPAILFRPTNQVLLVADKQKAIRLVLQNTYGDGVDGDYGDWVTGMIAHRRWRNGKALLDWSCKDGADLWLVYRPVAEFRDYDAELRKQVVGPTSAVLADRPVDDESWHDGQYADAASTANQFYGQGQMEVARFWFARAAQLAQRQLGVLAHMGGSPEEEADYQKQKKDALLGIAHCSYKLKDVPAVIGAYKAITVQELGEYGLESPKRLENLKYLSTLYASQGNNDKVQEIARDIQLIESKNK